MTFASQLRAPSGVMRVGEPAPGNSITIRVQMPEVWDVVRIQVSPMTSVSEIKAAALRALFPDHGSPDNFLVKLNGFEILDESAGVGSVGARDGSTLLLTFRRRRPVR